MGRRQGTGCGPAAGTSGPAPGHAGRGPDGPGGPGGPGGYRHGTGGALLVLAIMALAVNMRSSITGLPPVFPELQATLGLSPGAISALAALPVLCFGLFSGLGGRLSRRFGEERVLFGALCALAVGLAARGCWPGALLFPGTVLAGGSIALLNVLLPSLIKRRRPGRAGLLIGQYLLAMCGGAVLASVIAVPLLTAAGGGITGSRLVLGCWAVPAAVAAATWLPQLRRTAGMAPAGSGDRPGGSARPATQGRQPAAVTGRPAALRGQLLAWQVTAFMGLQSLIYYSALSWFPTLLRDRGASAAAAGNLLAVMNVGNAVGALLLPVLAHRARDQRVLIAAATLATMAGLALAAFGPLQAAAAWMLLLGLGQGATLGLAIFLMTARSPDPVTSASLSAFAQGIGYLAAGLGAALIGVLHAATGGWSVPLWTLLVISGGQLASGYLAGRARMVCGVPALVAG